MPKKDKDEPKQQQAMTEEQLQAAEESQRIKQLAYDNGVRLGGKGG